MGLFSKLFGSTGSDKADKMRQQAIDAFGAIQSPELKDLQIQLDKYVSAGRLTPEQAEAELLNSNAFNDIVTDPSLAAAQKQALTSLQQVGNEGGLTAIDRARLQDITNEQNQVARGRNESIMQQAQQRGMGGSDITTVNQLMNEQAAADRASQRGTDVAAEAQARALQALVAAGQTAGQIRGQEYGEQANKAQAANAIDLFNKQTLNQTNLYNVDAANRAQAANLANEQSILNANTGTSNAEKQYNAQAVQQQFSNEMAKAGGKAGTFNAWADDANAARRSELAADQALLGGAVQAGATAFGGPAAGMAAGQVMQPSQSIGGGNTTNSNYKRNPDGSYSFADGGEVPSEEDEQLQNITLTGMNCGGMVKKGMAEGGEVKTPMLPVEPNQDGGWTITDPNGQVVGSFPNYAEAALYAEKVRQKQPNVANFKQGGEVPGQASMPGDHPANDTVHAKLSPGEVVVPRTAMSDDEEFDAFMEKFRPSKRTNSNDPEKPLIVQALQNLSSRVDRMEGR